MSTSGLSHIGQYVKSEFRKNVSLDFLRICIDLFAIATISLQKIFVLLYKFWYPPLGEIGNAAVSQQEIVLLLPKVEFQFVYRFCLQFSDTPYIDAFRILASILVKSSNLNVEKHARLEYSIFPSTQTL